MGANESVSVLASVALGFLLLALGWAAFERGRIHHQWTRLRSEHLLRVAHRARRVHLAVGVVVGWV
jgi:hypothetical protein